MNASKVSSEDRAQRAYEGFDRMPIGGVWREGRSENTLVNRDPYTGEELGKIRLASRADVDDAYSAALTAQREWSRTTPAVRANVATEFSRLLREREQEVVEWLVREAGSTPLKARAEIRASIRETELAASFPYRVHGEIRPSDKAGKEIFVFREPLGVVTVISPWNFPLELSVRSVIPALVLGNAVVLKPASDTPVTGALLVAKLLEEAGLPSGLLNVVIGSGSEIGDYLVEHRASRFVSFTGSTEVGRRVGRLASGGQYIKRVALELGGNAAVVVLEDADVQKAAKAAVFGRFLHQGQICMSTNRAIVLDAVHDVFVEAVVAIAGELDCSDPRSPSALIGPIINEAQLADLTSKIARAKSEGATAVVGGEADGSLLPPHVFIDVEPTMGLASEESFGPILPIIRARDEEHAIEIANMTEFGLSSSVFGKDIHHALSVARRLEAGMTHVNDGTVQNEPHVPFGGEKNSGVGRFNGEWIIEEMTRTHTISVQTDNTQ